jgi:predicted transcriptional regulator of viral defense system
MAEVKTAALAAHDSRSPLSEACASPRLCERVLTLVGAAGIARSNDLQAWGIHPQQLRRLTESGALVRVSRGLYALPTADLTEFQTYAEACTRFPRGTLCLLSALRFHDLTTQNPVRVWMAFDNRWGLPSDALIPLRRVNMSGESLTAGVETHLVAGIPVRVYDVPKTIADCFKYRSAIGLDVALEALKEAWMARSLDLNLLARYAQICRVQKIVQPYLEMLVL